VNEQKVQTLKNKSKLWKKDIETFYKRFMSSLERSGEVGKEGSAVGVARGGRKQWAEEREKKDEGKKNTP